MSTSSAEARAAREAHYLADIDRELMEKKIRAGGPTKKTSTSTKRSSESSRPRAQPAKRQLVDLTDLTDDSDDDVVLSQKQPLPKVAINPEASSSKSARVEFIDSSEDEDMKPHPRRFASSSSSKAKAAPYPIHDRGDPIWIKKRDEKNIHKHGSANPSYSSTKPARMNDAPESAPVVAPDEPKLSFQQGQILDRIMAGESFFFTGPAGTGKSVLFRAIVKAFADKSKKLEARQRVGPLPFELGITASTGMAAINVGGMTLHSWAGVGLGVEKQADLARAVYRIPAARQRWERSSALIIDEISMIDGKLFDKLDYVGQQIRRNQKPFGGLQLILCGDFHQLPPVAKWGEPQAMYAFESEAWKKTFTAKNTACLKQVFRQKDAEFVRILEEMRKGRVSRPDLAKIQNLQRACQFPDDIPPICLYPMKREVDNLNSSKLAAIKAELHKYVAQDIAGVSPNGTRMSMDQVIKLMDQTKFVPDLEIKVGAIVMLLTNALSIGLCNGSTGKIVEFMTAEQAMENNIPSLAEVPSAYDTFPVVEFIAGKYSSVAPPKKVLVPSFEVESKNPNGSLRAKRIQLPLMLAWGMTVHKAQGSSLDRVKVDLKSTFADGQAYVAISRATSMDGLQVLNFSPQCVKVCNRVVMWSMSVEGDI